MDKQVNVSTFYRFMSNIYGITLLVFNDAKLLTEQYSVNPESAEFLLSFENLKERIFQRCSETKQPQVVSSELGQLWAGIPIVDVGRITGLIVIGPVFTSGGSTNLMLDYVRSYNISTVPRETLLEALNQTPVCSYSEFTRLIAIVYAFTYGEALDTSSLPIVGLTSNEASEALEQPVVEQSRIRPENVIDPTKAFSNILLECIQEGNVERLKRLLKTSDYSNLHQLSLPDPIRQQRTLPDRNRQNTTRQQKRIPCLDRAHNAVRHRGICPRGGGIA